MFIQKDDFDFGQQDQAGLTPLMYSIKASRFDITKLILSKREIGIVTIVNDQQVETLKTPLHMAVEHEITTKLPWYPSRKEMCVESPLNSTGIFDELKEVILMLVKKGAALNAADSQGRTPLHYVACKCSEVGFEVAKLLASATDLKTSEAFEVEDQLNETALELAVKGGCKDLVVFFLTQLQANCSSLNKATGLTPLHLAKKIGYNWLADAMVATGYCSYEQEEVCGMNASSMTFNRVTDCHAMHPKVENGKLVAVGRCLARIECNERALLAGDADAVCLAGTWHVSGKCVYPQDCQQILELTPSSTDGVYRVFPDGLSSSSTKVYCKMSVFGGGWTVFQRRVDGSESFFLGWDEYKKGFGSLDKNFWLGNDNIHRLTYGKNQKLLVILVYPGSLEKGHAYYKSFQIRNESDYYRLEISPCECGTSSDSIYSGHSLNGMKFSTKDKPGEIDCANRRNGAWWYNGNPSPIPWLYGTCGASNLNGQYGRNDATGIRWRSWKNDDMSMAESMMMIRRSELTC